jgi:hypothetical protein
MPARRFPIEREPEKTSRVQRVGAAMLLTAASTPALLFGGEPVKTAGTLAAILACAVLSR